MLDALGERWAGELCQDNYLAPEYFAGESQDSGRWGYYRCGSRGQNTIVFNNTNQLVDALPATSYATGASSCNRETDHGKADFGECNSSFWVADLSSVYTGGLSSFRRGLRLLGGRRGVLIQDELELVEEASEWRMHTNASISYSNGRRTARKSFADLKPIEPHRQLTGLVDLELNGKRLDVFIDAPSDLRFDNKSASGTVSNAQLPKGATDMPNPNVTVLSINIPAGNTTLAVRFLPQWVTREVGMDAVPPVLALQGWNLRSHTPSLGSR